MKGDAQDAAFFARTMLLVPLNYPSSVSYASGWWNHKWAFRDMPENVTEMEGTWIYRNRRLWLVLPLILQPSGRKITCPCLVDTGAPTDLCMSEGCWNVAKEEGILDAAGKHLQCDIGTSKGFQLEVSVFHQSGANHGSHLGEAQTCQFVIVGLELLIRLGLDIPNSKIKLAKRDKEADYAAGCGGKDKAYSQMAQQMEVVVHDKDLRTFLGIDK